MMSGALTPAQAENIISLDTITVTPTKTPENVWDSLSATSTVRQGKIDQLMPSNVSDLLVGIPSVTQVTRGDDPATAINIRGLQDFGRVAVVVDGARQNFQRSGHNANGMFYLEPELLSGVDITRGPVANIYGSGAIGGVASFTTKDAKDILKGNERWAVLTHGLGSTNGPLGMSSVFAAARPNDNVDIFVGGTYRSSGDYRDGHGDTVPNTGQDIWTGISKLTVRPGEGQEIKFGGIHYDAQYDTGQAGVSGVYGTHVENDQFTAKYTYKPLGQSLIDLATSAYFNRSSTDQVVKVEFSQFLGPPPAVSFTGPVGTRRNFTIDTKGFDLNNTSRFDWGPFRNAVTVGGDGFRDDVSVSSTGDPGSPLTPGGTRNVSGAFVQWKANDSTWLETIGALRYDNYSLEGGDTNANGDRVSPKITVGVTPIAGVQPYVTYAEGYRAPAVTETLVVGFHPGNLFFFLPNPNLRPEIGKTSEAGLNLKFDNVFAPGDKFRGKFSVFRNNVTDYIDLDDVTATLPPGTCPVGAFGPSCFQYVNVPSARIEGIEFETMYDTGSWFAGLAGQHLKGRNLTDSEPLATIQPDSVSTTIGSRFLDNKLTIAARWTAVEAKRAGDIPRDTNQPGNPLVFPVSGAYNLVKLYAGYEPKPDVMLGFSIDNLLNEQYTPYMNQLAEPGVTFKGELKVRFSDAYFKKG